MRFGSLFAGIGGFDLGLERAGMTCAWQVEINDYATKILEKHWPFVTRFRDVRTVGSHNLEPVDLICGGFPCQDISLAGKGEGIEGKRSGLWKEFYRVICEIRPRYVLVENVSALRSRGLAVVLSDLASVGYNAEWHCLPASAFGANHQRDRIWILGYANGSGCEREGSTQPKGRECDSVIAGASEAMANTNNKRSQGRDGQVLSECSSERAFGPSCSYVADSKSQQDGRLRERKLQPDIGTGSTMADTSRTIIERLRAKPDWEQGRLANAGWWEVEPDVGRVADGVSKRVDRLKCLGNSIVPQAAEWIGRQIMTTTLEDIIKMFPDGFSLKFHPPQSSANPHPFEFWTPGGSLIAQDLEGLLKGLKREADDQEAQKSALDYIYKAMRIKP